LRQISEKGSTVTDPPLHNTRLFPAATGLSPDVYELVQVGGYDREVGEIWEGDAELTYFPDTPEDLMAIAPQSIIKGYRFSFAYSVIETKVLAQHNKEHLSAR